MPDGIHFAHCENMDVPSEISGSDELRFFVFENAAVSENDIMRLFYDMMCSRRDVCAIFTNKGVLIDCSKVSGFTRKSDDVWHDLYYHCFDSGFICIKDIYV